MIEWHEMDRQNYKNDWSYMEKFKINESPDIKAYYAEGKAKTDDYISPYFYQYKHIALD